MAQQQAKLERQMKKNNDMMKALKVTMESQALLNNTITRPLCTNAFEGLEMESDDDDDDGDDDNNAEDVMDSAVDDDLTTLNLTIVLIVVLVVLPSPTLSLQSVRKYPTPLPTTTP